MILHCFCIFILAVPTSAAPEFEATLTFGTANKIDWNIRLQNDHIQAQAAGTDKGEVIAKMVQLDLKNNPAAWHIVGATDPLATRDNIFNGNVPINAELQREFSENTKVSELIKPGDFAKTKTDKGSGNFLCITILRAGALGPPVVNPQIRITHYGPFGSSSANAIRNAGWTKDGWAGSKSAGPKAAIESELEATRFEYPATFLCKMLTFSAVFMVLAVVYCQYSSKTTASIYEPLKDADEEMRQ